MYIRMYIRIYIYVCICIRKNICTYIVIYIQDSTNTQSYMIKICLGYSYTA